MNKPRMATYLANVLDHFDSSLYGFLVPILAPLFFIENNPTVGLIKGYGIFLLGILTRPLGAWYFSKVAQQKSPHHALIRTIQGITISTVAFTFVQPHADWGIWSAISLCVLKSLQNFFSSGEVSIASLYVLENSNPKQRHPITSAFLSSTMIGIGLAGLASTILFYLPNPEKYWKYPFYLSALTACCSWWLRRLTAQEQQKFLKVKFNIQWKTVLILIPIASLYYVTYSVPMVFFNSFAAALTTHSIADLMASNTALIVLDVVLLISLGKLCQNIDALKLLKTAAFACIVIMPVTFALIPNADFITLVIIRIAMIVVGVLFSIPLHRYYFENLPTESRYSTSALSYAIGSEVFGRSFPAVGLFLWKTTGVLLAPAFYVCAIAAAALFSLKIMQRHNKANNYAPELKG